MKQLFYNWNLKNGYPKKNGVQVFGTFICGGGSTMGYKLAGCEHLGGVEIDKAMARIYKHNHKPKYLYNEDIRIFNQRNDIPRELYNLDILDGSPPCSTFSMAGSRKDAWGKEKKFREGQAEQELDDLVFVYCETIKKLQPKVFILENVKGIIQGEAKAYTKKIVEVMNEAGYKTQVFLLNGATMGLPQKRERVFFIGRKKGLNWQDIKIQFNEKPILFKEIKEDVETTDLSAREMDLWSKRKSGDAHLGYVNRREYGRTGDFGTKLIYDEKTVNTILAGDKNVLYSQPRRMTRKEILLASSWPHDYDFLDQNFRYVCGMSVPPIMTAKITQQIIGQWFQNAL